MERMKRLQKQKEAGEKKKRVQRKIQRTEEQKERYLVSLYNVFIQIECSSDDITKITLQKHWTCNNNYMPGGYSSVIASLIQNMVVDLV